MSENHDAIVTDAKSEDAGAAPSRTGAPRTPPRAVATVSGGPSAST